MEQASACLFLILWKCATKGKSKQAEACSTGGDPFPMLKIGQLAQIKSDSPYVYEALTQIVNGVNAVGRATGVDPSGSIAAPSPIGGLNVTAADGGCKKDCVNGHRIEQTQTLTRESR